VTLVKRSAGDGTIMKIVTIKGEKYTLVKIKDGDL